MADSLVDHDDEQVASFLERLQASASEVVINIPNGTKRETRRAPRARAVRADEHEGGDLGADDDGDFVEPTRGSQLPRQTTARFKRKGAKKAKTFSPIVGGVDVTVLKCKLRHLGHACSLNPDAQLGTLQGSFKGHLARDCTAKCSQCRGVHTSVHFFGLKKKGSRMRWLDTCDVNCRPGPA